jgi:hypothetical protein
MNRPGRSVAVASRVIDDDRVRLQHRHQCLEDLALDRLVLDHRLDHQVAVGEHGVVGPGLDPAQRRRPVVAGDLAAGDLAVQVARNRVVAPLQELLAHVGQLHPVTGERTHMRDAGAHLAGADDADGLDHGSPPLTMTVCRARRRAPAAP